LGRSHENGNRDRLRIAYVHDGLYPYFKGGAERRLFETARALAAKHDVTHITWRYWDGPGTAIDGGVKLIGVGPAPSFYGADGKRRVGESVSFAALAARVLAAHEFDVVDCCATPLLAIYLSWFASRMHGQPLVVTWHEYWDDYWLEYLPKRPALARIARTIEQRALPLADHVVAVSEFTAQKLRKRGVSPVSIVENGVSLSEINACPPEADAPEVLFAGRLIDDKKVDWLIEAIATVREIRPETTCGVVGDGPEREKLEAQVEAMGLAQSVRFYGFVEEGQLYSLMKGAKVFAFPSVREGFGMAVAEAQACGSVPVVVDSPRNAASALVSHGTNGLVSTPSSRGLADAIAFLLTNEGTRSVMAKKAREAGADRDWSAIANQLEGIYLSLATSRKTVVA
jgi:glycosyltransferase involved in cell wall biosynthesis